MGARGSSWMVRASEASGGGDRSLEEVVGLLFRLTADLRQRFTDRAAEFDLSFSQAMALRELDDPLPMRDLADRLCCDASNVTGIVDRLEELGLVDRRTSAGDRRVKQLVLTEAGDSVRQEHRSKLIDDLPLLVDLTPDERRQLAGLLRRCVREADPSVSGQGSVASAGAGSGLPSSAAAPFTVAGRSST